MRIYNVSNEELHQAVIDVSGRFGNNVVFNRHPEKVGTGLRFTLRVINSKGPGHRRGFSGRRLVSACWHVHGQLFDELLGGFPNVKIVTGLGVIRCYRDNWRDRNIGSMMKPLMFSEACDCNDGV